MIQIPSTRTVSQTPSTPRGCENAISAAAPHGARHGSPELWRLQEATAYGFFPPAHRAAAATALASCAYSPSEAVTRSWARLAGMARSRTISHDLGSACSSSQRLRLAPAGLLHAHLR